MPARPPAAKKAPAKKSPARSAPAKGSPAQPAARKAAVPTPSAPAARKATARKAPAKPATITTIHGWPAITSASDKRMRWFPVPGVPTRKMLLRADAGPYLVAFAAEYHQRIAPLDVGILDDWSWSPLRDGRAAPGQVSDHCAGVALDLNAVREGSQGAHTLKWWANPARRARLAALRRKYRLLEWGGDYKRFRDPMHWTFNRGVTAEMIQAEMRRLGIDQDGRIAS